MENPELDLAFKYLEETGINVFLTGKAGTGKTTFLHHLKQKTPKRMIVLAPTGVAAINAGGVTIHSFFQLPFAPYLPEMFNQQSGEKKVDHQFSKTKINIIRSIDLLVIDEISMVRADLLDAVDEVLRRFRRNSKPFGGVQMLMIGDLQQLTPVVTDEENELLQRFYPSPFFFDSKALKTINFVSIELKHIYRQQDPKFIDLLNSVRENKISEKTRALLNQRYIPDFEPSDEEKFITLTTHNSQAKQINSKKMELLDGKTYTFDAQIIDNFPEYLFPTDEYLELKLKTQVMFVKNDSSALKQYFNGKIGVITDIGDDHLEVTCEGDENPIEVLREEWTNAKYTIDEESKAIVEKVEGRFIQFPLKAAWAITIHKSQGLTFEKAIIDANKAFAHGQVYVALSRCRSLEGMVLTSPISQNSLILDHNIEQFSNEKSLQQPSFQNFLQSAKNYYKELLIEQFDFSIVKENFSFYSYRVNDFLNKIYPEYVTTVKEVLKKYNETVIPVSERFQKQLERLVYYSENYLKDAALSERIEKGTNYFLEQHEDLIHLIKRSIPEIDNKENKKVIQRLFNELKLVLNIKMETLHTTAEKGFSVINYLSTRSNATIEGSEKSKSIESSKKSTKKEKPEINYQEVRHPLLYETLREWRLKKANEKNAPIYTILQQKALIGIANTLPETKKDLLNITGIGKVIVERYGESLLQIVEKYRCSQQ